MNPDLLDLVRDTPLARVSTPLPQPHPGFWAKLECLSAGGMKARAALSMLRGAHRRGDLLPGAPVVESTSGTLGIGLAFAGNALGHPIVLVVDKELEPGMRALLRAHGARLEIVDKPHPEGGWQQARLDRVREICRSLPGAYWPDQYNNPDNPAGYAEMGAEICRQLDRVDVLVCSVGSGGHSAGMVRTVRKRWPKVRLIGVDTVGSTIFGQPARPRVMRGLGSSIHPRNVDYPQFDEVHWIGPGEAVATCRALARNAFVTGGWSTGAVALVAAWAARVDPGANVVTVFPDGPQRYLGTVFDDDYCQARGLLDTPIATRPVEVANPEVEATGWTRCRTVIDPLKNMEVPA
ncbi:PLP-dependent cysteine synthase family protein [Saccharopolyspora mangrovi]|uniref:PLP-dependent cysteine synthase family protein n=1 Tax=Saccharopolyspora mangrovi TaxID=3082379 RepID=A0ABU6AHA8_9PSEU|nr:PLP-dependent cysteine synthase family protein [Saccharopolyspora sp. S2-29]MEB3370946.1 PLP-dependent cysteine synthase family protein [Saccharopolyspora sp. S2-29]